MGVIFCVLATVYIGNISLPYFPDYVYEISLVCLSFNVILYLYINIPNAACCIFEYTEHGLQYKNLSSCVH